MSNQLQMGWGRALEELEHASQVIALRGGDLNHVFNLICRHCGRLTVRSSHKTNCLTPIATTVEEGEQGHEE